MALKKTWQKGWTTSCEIAGTPADCSSPIRYPAIGPRWRDEMQFDQLMRRDFITLLGGVAVGGTGATAGTPAFRYTGTNGPGFFRYRLIRTIQNRGYRDTRTIRWMTKMRIRRPSRCLLIGRPNTAAIRMARDGAD